MRYGPAAICLLSISTWSSIALSAVISGSFSAVASNSRIYAGGNFDGGVVTETFSIPSTAGAFVNPLLAYEGPGSYTLPQGISQTFKLPGVTLPFSFPNQGNSDLFLVDTGSTQTADFDQGHNVPYPTGDFVLTGPEGSLFDSIDDPASFHIGPGVSIVSPYQLSIRFYGNATLTITGETFNGVPVDEPATYWLFALALAGLYGLRRPSSRA